MILWKHWLNNIDALIIVIDSCNKEFIEETCDIFWNYFAEKTGKIPALFLANKIDVKESLSVDEICSLLKMKDLTERPWKIEGATRNNLEGIIKGLNCLDIIL